MGCRSIDKVGVAMAPLPSIAEPIIRHVLPLYWSLYYALPKRQWRKLRERHREVYPGSEQCPDCPKHCKTNTLDEHWEYDDATHTKIFVGATFICAGCHWLKSQMWRLETYRKSLPTTKPPHIIDCLGWTQDRVDKLRAHDLREQQEQVFFIAQQQREVIDGRAAIVPAPLERVPPNERERMTRVQVLIVPWKVDLSRLRVYGYTPEGIAVFEERMYALAAKRMQG
jgi:hypothetical protein